jgi:hypothetical protein
MIYANEYSRVRLQLPITALYIKSVAYIKFAYTYDILSGTYIYHNMVIPE